jgi:transcriptional regulator with XRE-family HTH domain
LSRGTYISGIERGIRNPTFLVLLRLAQVLGVPPAHLMAEDNPKGGAGG